MQFFVTIDENSSAELVSVPLQQPLIDALADYTHPRPNSDAAAIKNAAAKMSVEGRQAILRMLLDIARSRSGNRPVTLVLESRDTTVATPQVSIRKVAVQSDSRPNTIHNVTLHDKKAVSCTCEGFQHRQFCKHLARAESGQYLFTVRA